MLVQVMSPGVCTWQSTLSMCHGVELQEGNVYAAGTGGQSGLGNDQRDVRDTPPCRKLQLRIRQRGHVHGLPDGWCIRSHPSGRSHRPVSGVASRGHVLVGA